MEISSECKTSFYNNQYADFIIKADNVPYLLEQFSESSCIHPIDYRFTLIQIPTALITTELFRRFGYGSLPNCYALLDTSALEASKITQVQNVPALALRGQGVLIGMVDTGVNYTNPLLKNADGSTKILSIWDQTIENPNPTEDLLYGTEYNETQINQALNAENPLSVVPSIDENSHGTYLASIIAGNRDDVNDFVGVVPDSNLVVVKLKQAKQITRDFFSIPLDAVCFQENDIMFGIKYLLDFAERLNKPIAICIALGTNQGSHDGRDSLSEYLSFVGKKNGIAIVVAAGNEGNNKHHYYGTINRTPGYDTVEINVAQEEPGFSVELWGRSPGTYSIAITSPSGEYIPRIPARLGESRAIRFLFEPTVILVNYQIVEAETGDPFILIRFQNPSSGIWRINVYGKSDLALDFHMWLPIKPFIKNETFFVLSNPDTTITAPGNAIVPITVTAYNHTNQSLYIDSSRGFTRIKLPKPDIAAPGVGVYGPISDTTFGPRSGTSVSAAIVTGTAAMILEWGIIKVNNPNISTTEVRSYLLRGAKRESTQTYPNERWGFGILDIYNTFVSLRGDT